MVAGDIRGKQTQPPIQKIIRKMRSWANLGRKNSLQIHWGSNSALRILKVFEWFESPSPLTESLSTEILHANQRIGRPGGFICKMCGVSEKTTFLK